MEQKENLREPHSCCFPKRYTVVILSFFGMFNAYSMRVNISVAMVAMVNNSQPELHNSSLLPAECPVEIDTQENIEKENYKGDRYNWSPEMQGWILGSFYYVYFLSTLVGGRVAEKFGSTRIFSSGILVSGILTLLSPAILKLGLVPLMAARAVSGLAEGLVFPAGMSIVSNWSPKLVRRTFSAVIFSGATLGAIVTMSLSGWLCTQDFLGGWPAVFYVTGSVSCVWYVIWWMTIYDTPHTHPHITQDELSLYEGQEKKEQEFKVPWKQICSSKPFWATVVANFGFSFSVTLIQTELPTFLNTALHFNINAVGLLSALTNCVFFVSMWAASFLADKLRGSGRMNITTVRKLAQSIAGFGTGLCLLAIPLSGCNSTLIVGFFSLSLFFTAFTFSGSNVIHVDMSPKLAGTLYGLANGIGSLAGITGPAMVGFFTVDGYTLTNWNKAFYSTAAIVFVSTTIFVVFASAELQPWGTSGQVKDKNCVMMKLETARRMPDLKADDANNFSP